ncbi:MAG: DUF3850 domain-containing protein [Patescibacteria group bacterium]
MAVIKKKIWPEYFDAIESGRKTFELRLDDFDASEGDTLILEEWDPKIKKYSGRTIEKKVGFIYKFRPEKIPFWSKEEMQGQGFQIISLK